MFFSENTIFFYLLIQFIFISKNLLPFKQQKIKNTRNRKKYFSSEFKRDVKNAEVTGASGPNTNAKHFKTSLGSINKMPNSKTDHTGNKQSRRVRKLYRSEKSDVNLFNWFQEKRRKKFSVNLEIYNGSHKNGRK